MSIKKIIEIDVNARDAQKNLDQLTDTLAEQQKITIEFREELVKLEKQLKDTPKNALGAQKKLRDDMAHLKTAIKEQTIAERKLSLGRKEATTSINELSKSQGAYSQITSVADDATGGLASSFLKLRGAAKKGGAAMKNALISSGIGAAVVLLGLIVEHWDDISEFVGLTSRKQERVIANQKKMYEKTSDELELLEEKQKLIELEGGSTEGIIADKRKLIVLQSEQNLLLLEALQIQLDREESQNKEVSLLEKAKIFLLESVSPGLAAVERVKAKNKESEKSLEIEAKIQEAKIKALKLAQRLKGLDKEEEEKKKPKKTSRDKEIKATEDPEVIARNKVIEELSKLEDKYFTNQLDKKTKELNAVEDKYFLLIQQAEQYGLDSTVLEEARLSELAAIKKQYKDEDDEKTAENKQKDDEDYEIQEEARLKSVEELRAERAAVAKDEELNGLQKSSMLFKNLADEIQVNDLSKASLAEKAKFASSVLGAAGAALGKSTTAGKVAAVASTTIDTIQSGVSVFKGMTQSIPGPVGIAAGAVAAAGALASGYASVKKILSVKTPGGGGAGGGGSAPTAPTAPAFNLVGGTGTNQIQETIENDSTPIQAVVVSSAVTSAQEADRNAIEGATLG